MNHLCKSGNDISTRGSLRINLSIIQCLKINLLTRIANYHRHRQCRQL